MTALTLDAIAAAGVRVEAAPGDGLRGWRDRLSVHAQNRLSQLFLLWLVRRGQRLLQRGDAAGAARLTAWMRTFYQRLDIPSPALSAAVDAEAVRRPGPPLDMPGPPTPAQWFAPRKSQPRGHVFYVHGGSFVAERSPRITALVARLAAAANASVFAPDYRLAPEHPCPAAVQDIVAAWAWLRAAWPDEPVVALAESAGAAILLAALQQARDEGVGLPEGVVLLSPWVDLSLQSWSVVSASLAGSTPYTMHSLALMARLYLGERAATDPLASPLFGDFTDFPPTLVHASRTDILFDDAVRLAERLRGCGGAATLRFWADETHVWEREDSAAARRSIRLAADFIRERLD